MRHTKIYKLTLVEFILSILLGAFEGYLLYIYIQTPNAISCIFWMLSVFFFINWSTTTWQSFIKIALLEKDKDWRYNQARLEALEKKLDEGEDLTDEEQKELENGK